MKVTPVQIGVGNFTGRIRVLRGPFKAGNKAAHVSKMTPDAHKRRLAALFRGWSTNIRLNSGEKFMTVNKKRKKAKRLRIRLHMTIAKEAREIQDVSRMHAHAVIKRMAEIAETSHNETAAISAAQVILERAYGKANQTNTNVNLDANGKSTDVSGKELDTRIAKTLERIDAFTGRTAKAAKGKAQPADVREHDRNPNGSSLH